MALSGGEIDAAIDRATAFLLQHQKRAGHWEDYDKPLKNFPKGTDAQYGGLTALILQSLRAAGLSKNDPQLTQAADWLVECETSGIYAIGLRAVAMSLMDTDDKYYRQTIQRDARWLVENIAADGSYSYVGGKQHGDNSCTQFGVLGAWAATEVGAKVPKSYWMLNQKNWLSDQRSDGGWNYNNEPGKPSYGSMTAAGAASLFVISDRLLADPDVDREASLAKALSWFERNFTPHDPIAGKRPPADLYPDYYYLYAVERVALASGYKYFGKHDWFLEGAESFLKRQLRDGSWGSPRASLRKRLIDTAFGVLFLARGRAPVLVNKLNWGGDWNVTSRDVANVTRYVGNTFERHINWQIVTIDGDIEDLHEAPLLYLSGRSKADFTDDQVAKLQQFILQGGTLFADANRCSVPFKSSMTTLAKRLFPQYSSQPVGRDHPIYAAHFALSNKPRLIQISNGIRPLMILSNDDLSGSWHQNNHGRKVDQFKLMANLYFFLSDMGGLSQRLSSKVAQIQELSSNAPELGIARIRHGGNWDPEPYAWQRFSAVFANQTQQRLLVTDVDSDDPQLNAFKLAHLTAVNSLELSENEMANLRAFVEGGGLLVVDAAAGAAQTAQSIQECVTRLLPDQKLREVPLRHPIISGQSLDGGVDCRAVSYRRLTRLRFPDQSAPVLRMLIGSDELHPSVIFSPLDLSVALMGGPVFHCNGYTTDSASALMQNIVLYAASR